MPDLTGLKEEVQRFTELNKEAEDLLVLCELGAEASDADTAKEVATALVPLRQRYEAPELAALLAGPYDRCNAIVSLHAGAGGTEAQDWVSMLLRMYTRWARKRLQ